MNAIYVLLETTPGCVDLEVANLNVLPSPTVSLAQAPNGNICSGTTITMTASGANSYTYVLSPGASSTLNPISLNIPTVTALSNVPVVLQGRGANNCVHTQTIQLAINPNPTVTVNGPTMILCIGNTATLEASGAATYTWSGAGSSTLNPYNFTAGAPEGVNNFTVTGQSIEGCLSAGAVFTVNVNNCTSLEELNGGIETAAYPNPFSSRLYFGGFTGSVTIYNELGQLVMTYKSNNIDLVDTTGLPAGVYVLQMTGIEGQSAYRRMIKHQQ